MVSFGGLHMAKKYNNYTDSFRFKVALEAIKGNKTVLELSKEYGLATSQIYQWKKHLEDIGPQIFTMKSKPAVKEAELDHLHATIGRLKVENDFLERALDR